MEHCEDGGVNTEKQQKRKKRLESQRHSSGETKKGKEKSELSKIGLQEREEKIPVSLGRVQEAKEKQGARGSKRKY